MLPVAPHTGRVTYYDTVWVPGATAENLRNSVYDTYAKNFIFADYRRGLPDSAQVLRPREKAALNEYLMLSTVMLVQPGEEIGYVAGVSPAANAEATTPVRYLHFVLRLRTEPGVCYLTITDLHQRTTTMKREMERRMAEYTLLTRGKQAVEPSLIPVSTPVETMYTAWLPGSKPVPVTSKTAAPKLGTPTLRDAQLLDRTARSVFAELRQHLVRQGRSSKAARQD
ncbi:hypothetical protein [Hymenobacter koreensis]|uniref:DUF4468 domain-containing protein n=1 Tax=Hymenobacter koreensis TaxID=1084523 RepID=A0ABP8J8T2_9BACT